MLRNTKGGVGLYNIRYLALDLKAIAIFFIFLFFSNITFCIANLAATSLPSPLLPPSPLLSPSPSWCPHTESGSEGGSSRGCQGILRKTRSPPTADARSPASFYHVTSWAQPSCVSGGHYYAVETEGHTCSTRPLRLTSRSSRGPQLGL